jgi:RHS repeat-associated protein
VPALFALSSRDARASATNKNGTLHEPRTRTKYTYDANGHRVSKTSGGVSLAYLYDTEGHVVVETNLNTSPAAWTRGEIFAVGRHIATYSGGSSGTTNFIETDWLGTERVRTNHSGAVCETITSLPFGDGHSTSTSCGDVSPLQFTGKERDSESGLDNFGARYNSSAMGRFMSPDPAGLLAVSLKNPQTWNWYAYTMNNPLRYTDPTGKYTCADDKNKCQTDQDKAFEAARQRDLQSNDKAVVSAAQAYGDRTKDNHVGVGFVEGDQGGTSFNYSTDGKTVTYSITVQIPGSHVGIALDEDVGHEGTHVGQDQALAASIAPNGSFNNGLNLTTYGAENPAYHVNAAIIQASGQPRSLDPAGNYMIRPGDNPRQVNNTINRYLADTTNPYHGVTPQNPGPPAIIQTQRNP